MEHYKLKADCEKILDIASENKIGTITKYHAKSLGFEEYHWNQIVDTFQTCFTPHIDSVKKHPSHGLAVTLKMDTLIKPYKYSLFGLG